MLWPIWSCVYHGKGIGPIWVSNVNCGEGGGFGWVEKGLGDRINPLQNPLQLNHFAGFCGIKRKKGFKLKCLKPLCFAGADGRIRTAGLLITNKLARVINSTGYKAYPANPLHFGFNI